MAPQWLDLRYNSCFISSLLNPYNDLSYIFLSFLILRLLFSVGIRLRIWQWWVSRNCSWYLAISQSEAWPCFEDPPTFNSTEKNSMENNHIFLFSCCILKWRYVWKDDCGEHFYQSNFDYCRYSQILTKLMRRKLCADWVYRVASMVWFALRHWILAMVWVSPGTACCSPMKHLPTWLIWMNQMDSNPYPPSSASPPLRSWKL